MDLPDWVTSQEERIKSFKYWAYKTGPCSGLKMAEAGFHSSGKKTACDVATCYVCYKELDGWEENDDPWAEHSKHSPNCLYIQLGKIPSKLSVEDILRLEVERIKNKLFIQYEKDKGKLLEVKQSIIEEIKHISSSASKKNKTGRARSSAVKRTSRRK